MLGCISSSSRNTTAGLLTPHGPESFYPRVRCIGIWFLFCSFEKKNIESVFILTGVHTCISSPANKEASVACQVNINGLMMSFVEGTTSSRQARRGGALSRAQLHRDKVLWKEGGGGHNGTKHVTKAPRDRVIIKPASRVDGAEAP